jgi:hypothetical protein
MNSNLGRLDVLETLDVALSSVQIVGQRMEDAESSGLIDGAELSLGLVFPDNDLAHAWRFVSWGSSGVRPMRSKIFESETELGQNFFVRNALATVEGGAGSVDLTSFFLRDWLIVQGALARLRATGSVITSSR